MASLPPPVCKQCPLTSSRLLPLLLQLPSVLSKMDSKLLSRDYALVRKMMLHHVFPLQSKQIQIKFYSYQVMIDGGSEDRWVFLKGGKGPCGVGIRMLQTKYILNIKKLVSKNVPQKDWMSNSKYQYFCNPCVSLPDI